MTFGTDILKNDQINTMAVKRINESRILKLLYDEQELTQIEIKERLGLSAPTINQALQLFRRAGIFVDGEELKSSGGRKPRKIAFNYSAFYSVGVEIRPHHVDIVVIDLKGNVERTKTFSLDFKNSSAYWSGINDRILELISGSMDRDSILGVGISFPGEVSFSGDMIERATVLGLYNVSLDNIKRYFDFNVYIENGARAAGFGALWRNESISDAVYIVVTDDGVAGAVILNDRIFKGIGKAGAFGHMTLDPNGKRCFCGARGCWTAYCALSNLSELTDGDLKEFFRRKDEGDERCLKAWDRYLDYFAQALDTILLSMDLDIIIGGKLARYLRDDLPLLKEKMRRHPVLSNEEAKVSIDDTYSNALAVGAALIFVSKFLNGDMRALQAG